MRDASHFDWTLVPVFALIFYAYCVEVQKRQFNVILAGATFWGMDWIGEILNALVLKFSGYAPLWAEPGPTSYLILVGINVETSLMFLIYGLAVAKVLPASPKLWIWGLPNRVVVVFGFALLSALLESVLYAWGALSWDYAWWRWPHVWSIMLFTYGPATAMTVWVHDLKSRRRQLQVLAGIYGLVAVGFVVFLGILKWI